MLTNMLKIVDISKMYIVEVDEAAFLWYIYSTYAAENMLEKSFLVSVSYYFDFDEDIEDLPYLYQDYRKDLHSLMREARSMKVEYIWFVKP